MTFHTIKINRNIRLAVQRKAFLSALVDIPHTTCELAISDRANFLRRPQQPPLLPRLPPNDLR